jgi:hypothetical protein
MKTDSDSFVGTWENPNSLSLAPPPYDFPYSSAQSPLQTINMTEPLAHDISPTPSLCADGDYFSARLPISLKRSYSSSSSTASVSPPSPASHTSNDSDYEEGPAHKRSKRHSNPVPQSKRADSPDSACSKKATERIPHNQVERKYREGLNTQLEKLRRVVPTLCPAEDGEKPKPSKATILANAIAYIKKLEQERDILAKQVWTAREAHIRGPVMW